MNREQFINYYKSVVEELFEISDNVVVSAGGALLMLGLRESTNDLDLDVPENTFNAFKNESNVEFFGTKEIVNLNEVVSLHRMEGSIKTVTVDGVCIYSVEELISFKKSLIANPLRNKAKLEQDFSDLEKLEKLI